MDIGGPFCWTALEGDTHKQVLERLKNLESMTWGEIEGHNNHFVPKDGLTPEAKKRLEEIKHDDIDEVFSIRVTGAHRVIGIRDEHVLRILWYDPEHQVSITKYKQ
jgi:hypothetical protein